MAEIGSSGAAVPTELEWQFDALDLAAVERWLDRQRTDPTAVIPGLRIDDHERPRRMIDTYFDSAQWHVGRGGYVVRERRVGRHAEVTMKSIVDATDGFRRRTEVTEARELAAVLTDRRGPVGQRLDALLGANPLLEVVRVTTRRRPITLAAGERTLGELVLDETAITVPGNPRRLHLRRVELEVGADAVSTVTPFVQAMRTACALAPATLSKFEAGLLAAGRTIPGSPDLGPTRVGPDATIGELALVALRLDAAAMIEHEPGTRLGEDIEALHQMRVATRRLRAALSLFAAVLPLRALSLREEIGWLAAVLGQVRDLDVQLEQTEEWVLDADPREQPALAELVALLEAERQDARLELLEALNSRRYQRLVASLTTMLRSGAGRRSVAARTKAVVAMPELIERRHRRALKNARRARRSGLPIDFHELRIRIKRLRYAVDFASDLYGAPAARYERELATLQGRLGSMQDAEVASERLRHLALHAGEHAEPLSSEAVFTMGGLAARYRAESLRLLAKLPSEIDGLEGARWRRFAQAMQRASNEALEAASAHPAPSLSVAAVAAEDPGPGSAEPSAHEATVASGEASHAAEGGDLVPSVPARSAATVAPLLPRVLPRSPWGAPQRP